MLPEVLAFTQAAGFRLFDIVQFCFGQRGDLLQADMLFIRSEMFDDGR